MDEIVIDDPHATLTDGAHGQFALERDAELAHHDHVQRCAQRARDLERDRDPAARQTYHDDVMTGVLLELLGEPAARVHSIPEQHVSCSFPHLWVDAGATG